MKVLKKILLALLVIILAMGLGAGIYFVKSNYIDSGNPEPTVVPAETPVPTEVPVTEEPDLKQYVITVDTVNLRQEPTTDSAIVVQVGKDTVLQLLYSDPDWSSVIYEGQSVYVKGEFVTPYAQPVDTNQKGAGKIIAIDPGYQANANTDGEPIGPDAQLMKYKISSGNVGVGTGKAESELNLEIALKLKAALEGFGYQVVMTRTSNDVNISNVERTEIANVANANAYICIQTNGSTDLEASGVSGVCPTINNPYCASIYNSSYILTNALVNAISTETGAVNAGVWQTDTMTIINWSKVPVAVLKTGYMTNTNEEAQLITQEYQDKIVNGIVNGLDTYFAQ